MVKISIVMPVYNGAEFLQKSIGSVSKQTLKDLELICVDDGSTDNSLEVLNELSEKYDFIKIITQENNGPGAARNNGMENATGEYISFLDADDIFIDETALEEMYNLAKKNDVDIVAANLKFVELDYSISDNPHYNAGDYAKCEEYGVMESKDYGIPYAFYKNIFKREFLSTHQIRFPDMIVGEDPIFMAQALINTHEISTVPLDLYGYNHAVGGGVNLKINSYEKKKYYIQHFKDTSEMLLNGDLKATSDFYKIHMFRFLTYDDNNHDSEIIELFDEIFGIDNPDFDESDFNYTRFIVPAYVHLINKYCIEEVYRKANKKFMKINIYNTIAVTEKIIDEYLLLVSSYSLDDFKSNYNKYLSNNLKFNEEFMKFKIDKFLFNLDISKSNVIFNNAKMLIQNNKVWNNKLLSRDSLMKCYKVLHSQSVQEYRRK